MSDVRVRALGSQDWQTYRELRLAALQEAPQAFSNTFAQEAAFDEELWRTRMARSARLVATASAVPVGIVSVGQAPDPEVAELFGMWVVPQWRGAGVAWRLTEAAAEHARQTKHRMLQAWVSTENGRAVAFFSSYGFRPSDQRRAMAGGAEGQEMAMIYPVDGEPVWLPPPPA